MRASTWMASRLPVRPNYTSPIITSQGTWSSAIRRGKLTTGLENCWALQFILGNSQKPKFCITLRRGGKTATPKYRDDDRNIALYLFNEGTGSIVRDKAVSGVNLYIPEKYIVMNQFFLEPLWTELTTSRNYWGAAIKNVVGFIPFGFCFYAYMATLRSIRRPMIATIALGTAVSLTIEILQAFLPTRESGTTDIIYANTCGTWIGGKSYEFLKPTLARLFMRSSRFLSDRAGEAVEAANRLRLSALRRNTGRASSFLLTSAPDTKFITSFTSALLLVPERRFGNMGRG